MIDYPSFFWTALIYVGVVPGMAGAGILAAHAWRKGRAPRAVALAALKGFALLGGLAVLLVVAFLRF